MCSSRCERPASCVALAAPSRCRSRSRAPPSARAGMRSVTTRTPEPSSVSDARARRSLRASASVAVADGADGRSRAAPPSRPAPPPSRPSRSAGGRRARGPPPPPPPPPVPTPRAPRRSCRRSPGRRRRRTPMRPRSRSTSTTRTVISSPLLSTSSTRLDAVARRDVGDVQQAVGALRELDEGAEGGRLDDLAEVLVADLDLLHHRPDALDERVAELAVGGVDQHLAVVVDVDLGLELLAQAADRLAALADQQADLAAGRS